MDYYSCYKLVLNYYNKDISLTITQYIYAKCVNCNDSYHKEFYECACNRLRCKHHTYLKTCSINKMIYCNNCIGYNINSIKKPSVIIKCLYCTQSAHYGYKDLICYCDKHINFKKVLEYYSLCTHDNCINIISENNLEDLCNEHAKFFCESYTDSTISIESKDGRKCSFCKRLFLGLRYCRCSAYCSYCFFICTFKENITNQKDFYSTKIVSVCNNCCNNINMCISNNHNILCHANKCNNLASYSIYGILLFCDNHRGIHYIDNYNTCLKYNCYKSNIYAGKCLDHSLSVIQNKIMKMIKN